MFGQLANDEVMAQVPEADGAQGLLPVQGLPRDTGDGGGLQLEAASVSAGHEFRGVAPGVGAKAQAFFGRGVHGDGAVRQDHLMFAERDVAPF